MHKSITGSSILLSLLSVSVCLLYCVKYYRYYTRSKYQGRFYFLKQLQAAWFYFYLQMLN